jgi:hypothetical protein
MSVSYIDNGKAKIGNATVPVFQADQVDAKLRQQVKEGFEPLEAAVAAYGPPSPLPGGLTGQDNAREREAFAGDYAKWAPALADLAEAAGKARRYAHNTDLSQEGNNKRRLALVEGPLRNMEVILNTSVSSFERDLDVIEGLMAAAVEPSPVEGYAVLARELRAIEVRGIFSGMESHARMAPLRDLARRGDLEALEAVKRAVLPLVTEAVQELAFRDFLEGHAWLPAMREDARALLRTIAARADHVRGLVAAYLLKGIPGVPEIGNTFLFSNRARVRLERKIRFDLAAEVEKQLHADDPAAQDKPKPKAETVLMDDAA